MVYGHQDAGWGTAQRVDEQMDQNRWALADVDNRLDRLQEMRVRIKRVL